jgi:hypothetical protein
MSEEKKEQKLKQTKEMREENARGNEETRTQTASLCRCCTAAPEPPWAQKLRPPLLSAASCCAVATSAIKPPPLS